MGSDNIRGRKRFKRIYLNRKFKILFILFILLILFNILFFYFDRIVTTTILESSDAQARARVTEIINGVILEEFSKDFNYDEIIHIEKDNQGTITMVKADTLKMNKIASEIALSSQKKISSDSGITVSVPISYILKSTILSFYGPKIKIKMEPIGYIETKYTSDFESAGINQTRHKIYVQVKSNIRVFIPLNSKEIQVINEVPVAETIIVGKVPSTAINLDLNGTGVRLPSSTLK